MRYWVTVTRGAGQAHMTQVEITCSGLERPKLDVHRCAKSGPVPGSSFGRRLTTPLITLHPLLSRVEARGLAVICSRGPAWDVSARPTPSNSVMR